MTRNDWGRLTEFGAFACACMTILVILLSLRSGGILAMFALLIPAQIIGTVLGTVAFLLRKRWRTLLLLGAMVLPLGEELWMVATLNICNQHGACL